MDGPATVTGVLLDEAALDLEELARACGVDPDWVSRHVRAGVLGEEGSKSEAGVELLQLRFRSVDLDRARRLASLERDFDANEELAALVVDLADEVRRLRARLHALGVN